MLVDSTRYLDRVHQCRLQAHNILARWFRSYPVKCNKFHTGYQCSAH